MNKLTLAVQMAFAAVLVTGCSTYGGGQGQSSSLKITPFQRMTQEASPDSWYQLGRYYQGQSRWTDAENAFRRVLGLDPSHAEAHNALGAVLAARGFLAQAESEFFAASRLAPQAAHIRGNLGRSQWLQGRMDDALLTLEDALRLDPANLNVRANLDQVLAARNSLTHPVAVSSDAKGEGVEAGKIAPALTNGRPVNPVSDVLPVSSTVAGLPSVTISPAAVITSSPLPDKNQVVVLTAVPASEAPTKVQQMDVIQSSGAVLPVQTAYPGTSVISLTSVQRLDPVALAKTAQESAVLSGVTTDMSKTPAALQKARLEVSNGNGVTGMARRVRQSLSAQGYGGIRVTNQLPYRQQITAIQYRVGFENQARALGSQFPLQEKVVYQARLDVRADVRVVLGRDLPRDFALNEAAPVVLAAVEEK